MHAVTIDSEFAALCPSLSADERRLLEESLVAEGCRDPLVVTGNGVLLDGHNRYEICHRLGIAFKTAAIELSSRASCIRWIARNQLARRNLTPFQKVELVAHLEPEVRSHAKSRQGRRTDLSSEPTEGAEAIDSRQAMADMAGVGVHTYTKARTLIETAPEEMKAKLRAGDITVNRAFDDLNRAQIRERTENAIAQLIDEEPPDPPAAPRTRPGDVWMLGRHRVLCGDATKKPDVRRVMGDERAACMWTDPPYGVSYSGKTKDALKLENDDAKGLHALLVAAFTLADGVLAAGAPFYIAHPAGALTLEFERAVHDVGWRKHQELIWVKDVIVLGHSDYHLKHEGIIYGWTKGPGRSGRGAHEGSRWHGDDAQSSVFEVVRPKRSDEHPTTKPVELVARCLLNSTKERDVVFDPFVGSGTTLIACEQLGRACRAIEIEPRYVDVIVARWEKLTGETAKRVRG
jgi:DNA modification methylase